MTVLPRSRRRSIVAMSRALSRWCRPMRRLVEDVEHAHEPGADLRRQPDALGLAAGERRRAALEREVVEPHVDQEPQPLDDLLDDAAGDRLARARKARAPSKNASESFADKVVTW